MTRPAARRTHKRNVWSGTRLESLEPRCLLNAKMPAQITVVESPSTLVSGTTELVITGTKNNDQISISDNGTGTAGNIFVSYGGSQEYTSTGAVSEIGVETGTGKDQVTYELDGNLATPNQELVFVGSGAKKGGGSVQLTVNIVGKILDGSSLAVLEQPDPKKLTTMTVNDSGEVDGVFTAGVATPGTTKVKAGPISYGFQSTATIGSTGSVNVGMVGGSHNDTGTLMYSGTNDGEIDVTDVGNRGNDQLSADIFMNSGSTGTVGAPNRESVVEGLGKSHLIFTVEQGTDTTTTTNVFAQVVGLSKKVKVVHTANVSVTTKGSVTLVS
jgi:hypothetical protein